MEARRRCAPECAWVRPCSRRGKELAKMRMVKLFVLLASVSIAALVMAGCGGGKAAPAAKPAAKKGAKLCGKCGLIKGSAKCCKPGAKCGKCGLIKGSPGCCKLPKGNKGDVPLCGKCGQIKGAAKCCKPGAKCGKCGLLKGSPGCCKIK